MIQRTEKAYDKWAFSNDKDENQHIVLEYDEVMVLVAPGRQEIILDAAYRTGRYTQ